MTRSRRTTGAARESAATKSRSFRTFLLAVQFEAKEIGQRIASARNEAGLTQDALAGMSSFSKRSLQDYEGGVTIPYRHMREISRLLGKPVEWFLHGEQTDRLEALEAQVAQLAPAKMVQEGFEALERAIEHLGEQQSPPDEQPASGSPK